ncbi:glycosyltransferase [Bradyrhizobium japonicum]|uniref:glycosyltransferase n=1 Tax=Bradyrhizobium japonicum TaxID=375 RepID=UPI00057D0FF5|nr:glycosyltransferase [Bradyrhizobium japonicum]MCD9111474.1 glycosyltransferase [Bradyrhizobium japonicum]MCD9255528.1 glycosyltransferase [Bradyrhizobium japonicum SEMIA 5079]MCD9821299.1 glycosyltransferase [Bradyrhizobium japonicum]MCD9895577.1 glycosyltransferase [Bradyrhizobium japonicum]MCD9906879.1 glycosyltransferase [Bradyrhizobium japonicum]
MSFHPVTRSFADRITEVCGPVDSYYDAANLRKLSPVAALRQLRSLRADKLVIALESEVSTALIAPLSIAAALTRVGSLAVVWPDLRVEALGRLGGLRNLLQLGADTLSSRRALVRRLRKGEAMRRLPMPRQVPPSCGARILYLDANISLGAAVGGSVGHTAGVIGGFLDNAFEVDYASLKSLPSDRAGARWLKLQPDGLLAMPAELNFYPYAEAIEDRIVPLHSSNPWSFIYQRFSLHDFTGPHLGRRLNVPVVVEFNGSEAWASANWGTRLRLHGAAEKAEAIALDAADLIVTVSDELGDELKRRGIPDGRILVYPNCVDPAAFDSARFSTDDLTDLKRQHGIPKDALIAGFIGTFGQWHGIEFLAECIRNLVRDDVAWLERSKLHFMLVGDGLKMPEVRRLLGSPEVARFVTLTGLVAQSEAPRYLACADLLLSPHVPNADGSGFFGSPTKLFEYMAMEKPIVASALGQIEDVIAGRGATRLGSLPPGAGAPCGFLYEPGNAQAFKDTLRRVVDDMPAAAGVAKAARAEVLNRYTWKRHVDAILAAMARNGLLVGRPDRDAA